MGSRIWIATVLTCVSLLLFCVPPASAQDVRTGVEQLASQIAKGAPEGKQLRVAVADFPDLQGATSDLGRFIASRLTTRLAQDKKFFVIERQRLGQVLAELKFSMSDLVDPTKAKRLGQMAGVEAIVVGTVSDLGNQVDLDARLIEIETNRMLLGATATLSKDQVVQQLLERGRVEVGAGAPQPAPETPPASRVGSIRGFQGLPVGRVIERVANLWEADLAALEVRKDDVELRIGVTNLRSVSEYGFSSKDTYLVDEQGQQYKATKVSVLGGNDERVRIPSGVRRVFQILLPLPGPHASRVTWVIKPTMYPGQAIVIRNTTPMR